ncbi:hypothetical protein ACGFSD_03285 [Streptomyces caniferus]|uniref:hypothetical protein n=1 Tax=Streptomyces caniferus TaxID=285557 RepID=UPI0037171040
MIWWLKAKGAPAVVASTFAVYLMAVLVREEAIPVPAVVGPSGQLLVAQILGVLPVVLLLHGIDRGDTIAEEVALRHKGRRNFALCLAFAILVVMLAAVINLLWDRPESLSLARNCVGFLGAALIVRVALGPGIAAICIAALPLACAAAGRRPGGSAQPWAWPIQQPSSYLGAGEATFLFAVGCALVLWKQRPLLNPLARTA